MFGSRAIKANSPIRIAVDLMGGDSSPEVLLKGALDVAEQLPAGSSLYLLATNTVEKPQSMPNCQWHLADDLITMDDPPLHALKHKRSSTMHLGVSLLQEKKVDALVSCGNTGVLFGLSTLKLKRLKGVIRPALMATVPTSKGVMAVLDVGGNTDYKPEHLAQFALMGAAVQSLLGNSKPKVGLLNIGSESKKGPLPLREAYLQLEALASKADWEFVGNVEGKCAFKGDVSVLVTDGFTGNIFLKTAEGVSEAVLEALSSCPEEMLKSTRAQFCNDEYSGAVICGITDVVVKCHGEATSFAFSQAIRRAIIWKSMKLPEKIASIIN